MVYIAIKDNKIIHVCETQSADKVIASMQYEGIANYDQIIQVANDYFNGHCGQDIREFNNNFEILPLSERKDFVEIPLGMKIGGDKFIEMTVKEKIDSGIITLTNEEIYDENLKKVIPKDIYKLAEDNIVSIEQVKDYQKNQTSQNKDQNLLTGSFFSTALGIEVDCRRGINEDKQNVENLISYMSRKNISKISYKGCTESVLVDKKKLENLLYEMEDYILELYQKKILLYSKIDNANTITKIKDLHW